MTFNKKPYVPVTSAHLQMEFSVPASSVRIRQIQFTIYKCYTLIIHMEPGEQWVECFWAV